MPDGVDTIFLDIAGCTRLFGGEEALMASLGAALEDFGLTARLALADTPGAAWALAHYGADHPAVVPAGTGPDGLKNALAKLPVAALRLSAEVADGLASFGLDRICTLFVMESVKLIRRFGVEPVRRLDQALGRVDEPIVPLRPLPPREARLAFAEPISTPTDIRAAVDGLLDDLCLALSRTRALSAAVVDGSFVESVYNKIAVIDDWLFGATLHTGRLEAIRRLDLQPGDAVLEVGVGTGINAALYPSNVTVTGIDVAEKMLAKAARRLASHKVSNVRLMQMDATHLDFPDDSFDLVYAPYVISTVSDPVTVAREMRRVCRPGGDSSS